MWDVVQQISQGKWSQYKTCVCVCVCVRQREKDFFLICNFTVFNKEVKSYFIKSYQKLYLQ